jgi:hypothetical protein
MRFVLVIAYSVIAINDQIVELFALQGSAGDNSLDGELFRAEGRPT